MYPHQAPCIHDARSSLGRETTADEIGTAAYMAVGGPSSRGHKLFVETKTVIWDGQPVSQDFPSDSTVPGTVDMHYNGFREAMQNGREGKALHAVYIRL